MMQIDATEARAALSARRRPARGRRRLLLDARRGVSRPERGRATMDDVMQVTGAAVFVPALAAIAFAASAGAGTGPGPGGARPVRPGRPGRPARATLMPVVGDPFKVRGTGFHARERVRVTVTPTGRDALVRRVRATGRGTFVLASPASRRAAGSRAWPPAAAAATPRSSSPASPAERLRHCTRELRPKACSSATRTKRVAVRAGRCCSPSR